MKRGGRAEPREDGNIIIAMIIILIVTSIGTAVAARELGDQTIVVSRQHTASALATANAGVSDALFRLDQGPSAEGSGTQFYVDPTCTPGAAPTPCVANTVPGIAAGATVEYVANQISVTEWTIDSVGTVGTQTAAVHEVVTRGTKYPFALFANSALTFNGNASGSFSTYSDTATESSSNPNSSGTVAIGSNGSITCNGGIGTNVQADYYNTGSVSSISGSCGTPQSFNTTYYLPPASASGLATNCPHSGQLGSGYGLTTLTAESIPYVCRTPVSISGNLEVSGSVTLYIDLSGNSSYNSSTSALTIATPSYVNDMYDYCQATPGDPGCAGPQDLPNAENLQILVDSPGQVGFDNGHGYYFGGILYAPQAYLTEDGCKSEYYGAVTINTLTCNGGPHLSVSYDSTLSSLYGNWAVSGYAQVNPKSVTIP